MTDTPVSLAYSMAVLFSSRRNYCRPECPNWKGCIVGIVAPEGTCPLAIHAAQHRLELAAALPE